MAPVAAAIALTYLELAAPPLGWGHAGLATSTLQPPNGSIVFTLMIMFWQQRELTLAKSIQMPQPLCVSQMRFRRMSVLTLWCVLIPAVS